MLKKVLLVDDDREMLLALKEGLTRWGDSFAVSTAGNGVEALEFLRSQEVSLVVTDLKMPVMDGLELLAAILQSYPDIPVIVMTGFSTPETERLVRTGGAVGFITKPFSIDTLARQMNVMLGQQSEGGTLHNVSPAMFLQLIEMEQKTCTVRLEHTATGSKGILSFVEGELFDARVGDVQGLDAAYQIFAWEPVSLAFQNHCRVRENRIRRKLYPLILEAARRRDEKAPPTMAENPPGNLPAQTPDPAESLALLRAGIEKALGTGCGVEDLFEDPSWSERVSRISSYGERLNLGRLTLACVNWGDSRDFIVRPAEPPVVIAVSPKCPREKLMQFLGG
jgi:CheY-like chemotaxis protein